MGLFLYSTQPYIKYHINEALLGKRHYVWCSEVFDGRLEARINIASTLGKSSNPAEIYDDVRQYAKAGRADRHCDHIIRWRASIPTVAVELNKLGRIDDAALKEITYLVKTAEVDFWRLLLYVIDRQRVGDGRIQLVEPERRAGVANEYVINDLTLTEADILEF